MARIYFLWTYFNTRFKQEKKLKNINFSFQIKIITNLLWQTFGIFNFSLQKRSMR